MLNYAELAPPFEPRSSISTDGVAPRPRLASRSVDSSLRPLVGDSPPMRDLGADLERLATTDATVLIEGETGTGKDVAAEWIHRKSSRAKGPYVVFDCSSVVASLAEAELFGHERGAFTGAIASRPGAFELANGGTLFLDELGELPKDLQPKLLRVLEKREVRRVGGVRTIPIDARIIAATNRNLQAAAQNGRFREDLYFRVAVAQVTMPALRDRMEDLPLLVEHFLSMERPRRSRADVPQGAWDQLLGYHWPGNVRELRNAVQRLFVTPTRLLRCGGPTDAGTANAGTAKILNLPVAGPHGIGPLRVARREANEAFEKDYLTAVMRAAHGNVSRAAAIAGVSRQLLTKLLQKHEIRGRLVPTAKAG